ncbi:hypothetical protein BIW11_03698 [Tropilaelaps mercedesae]|uniref:Uncharacterized protein n=1 Tax=Tropilaelaps mercedesae TaxID=418985 RepID=A0A1V9XH84_9ACAR|nr:hypothetical protein BIW11_03698 [Tropilaelaps mercedesae]
MALDRVLHQLDIDDGNTVDKLQGFVQATHGGLDVLVNIVPQFRLENGPSFTGGCQLQQLAAVLAVPSFYDFEVRDTFSHL